MTTKHWIKGYFAGKPVIRIRCRCSGIDSPRDSPETASHNLAIMPRMFVSVTRLRVRSIYYLPQFLWYTFTIQRQAERAQGLIGVRLLVDSNHTYWTLTSWESEKSMKSFRGAAPHSKAMKKLPKWCDEAAYTHWTEDAPRLPEWNEAYERFVQSAKLSKVEHPSAAHQHSEFRQPNLKSRLRRDFAA